MEVKAHLKNLRISPRKVRLVVDLIRGMDVGNAKIQLECMSKKSSEPVLKLLNSAIANAKNNFNLDEGNLYVSQVFVNGGAVMKRFMPRAQGRASEIMKRTCHIMMVLDEKQVAEAGKEKKEAGKKNAEKTPANQEIKAEAAQSTAVAKDAENEAKKNDKNHKKAAHHSKPKTGKKDKN